MRFKKTLAAVLAATTMAGLAACGSGASSPSVPQVDAYAKKNTIKNMKYLALSVHSWGDFCGSVSGDKVRSNKVDALRDGYFESHGDGAFTCDYSPKNPTGTSGNDPKTEAMQDAVQDVLPDSPKTPDTVKGLNDLKDSAGWYMETMHEAGILVDKTRLVSLTVNPDKTLTATVSSDLLGRFAAWPDEDDWENGTWTHRDKLVEYKDVRLTAVLNHTGTRVLKLKDDKGRYEWYLGPNVYGKPKTEDASMFAATGREKRLVSYAPVLTAKADKTLTKGFYLCQLLGYDGFMASKCEEWLTGKMDDFGNDRPANEEEKGMVSKWLDSQVRYSFTQAPQWHETVKANTSK